MTAKYWMPLAIIILQLLVSACYCKYLLEFKRGVCPPPYIFISPEEKAARCEEVKTRSNFCTSDADCKKSGVCCDLFECNYRTCTQAVDIPEGVCPPTYTFRTEQAHADRCDMVSLQRNTCQLDSDCQANARCCDQYDCHVTTCTQKVYIVS